MALDSRLHDCKYRNWVRASLGLEYLKQGLTSFVTNEAAKVHATFIASIRQKCTITNVQCSACQLKTLIPAHVSNNTPCPHPGRCCCFKRNKIPCPNGICGELYDIIVSEHNLNNPIWNSTNSLKWTTSPWELSKCDLSSSGYKDKQRADECDASGLLSICINCRTIRSRLSDISQFEQARTARNDILHSSLFELEDATLADHIGVMLKVLNDPIVQQQPDAAAAITHLQELLKDERVINKDDETKARETALAAVEAKIIEVKTEIDQLNASDTQRKTDLEQIQSDLIKTKYNHDDAIKTLKKHEADIKVLYSRQDATDKRGDDLRARQDTLETHHADIEQRQDFLANRQDDAEKRIAKASESTQIHQTIGFPVKIAHMTFGYDKGLRRYLIKTYQKHYLKVDVSPLFPEVEHIDEMFIPITLTRKLEGGLGETEEIKTFNDLFSIDRNDVRIMFMAADAGMGKTTLCQKIVSTWCKAFDKVFRRTRQRDMSQPNEFTSDEEQWRETEKQNIHFMKKFKYLFFVYLRHAHEYESMEEMVEHQLLDDMHRGIFRHIIDKYPHLCLFILDGLDEWNPSRMPQENPRYGDTRGLPFANHFCTILYTTRPWKLTEIIVRDNQSEEKVQLDGLSDRSSTWLVQKMVSKLNRDRPEPLLYPDFFTELQTKHIEHFQTIPIMLKLLVCLWFEHRHLSEKITVIYSDALNLVLKHFSRKKAGPNRVLSNRKSTCLPDMLGKADCTQYTDLLLALCLFAHTTYENNHSLVFMADQLQLHGMSSEDVQICLDSGLLSKTAICKGAIDLHVQVSYMHKTFQEFFVAVHLAAKQDQLAELLAKCNTRASLTEQFVVLRYVCGLENKAVRTIAEHIYTNLSRDVPDSDKWIQNTMFSFIKESQQTDERSVPLNQVQIQNKGELKMVKYVDPSTVNFLFCFTQMPEPDYLIQMCGLVRVTLETNTDKLHLTHSQVSTLLCLPELSHLTMGGVQCHSDMECGCDTKELTDVSILNSTGTMHVKCCNLTNTSQVLCHVLDAPELETLYVSDSDVKSHSLHRIIQTCKRIEWVHIDNLSIDDVNIQFSPQIRSLRIVKLRNVPIRAATLKSLIQSVPSNHPAVRIELQRVDIAKDDQFSWLRQTWNMTSGFVDYERIVVNKSISHKPRIITVSRGMQMHLYEFAIDDGCGCDVYSEDDDSDIGFQEKLLMVDGKPPGLSRSGVLERLEEARLNAENTGKDSFDLGCQFRPADRSPWRTYPSAWLWN